MLRRTGRGFVTYVGLRVRHSAVYLRSFAYDIAGPFDAVCVNKAVGRVFTRRTLRKRDL